MPPAEPGDGDIPILRGRRHLSAALPHYHSAVSNITAQQFSTYKSNEKKSGGKGGTKRAPKGTTEGRSVGNLTGNGMVVLDDLEAARALVAKVGAEQAKRLVGLFE